MEDKDRFYKHVGEKIRAARGKRLSQEALATAIGLTRTSVSNIENGRQKMLLHTLVDLAAALNVDPARLLPDRHVPPETSGIAALAQLPENERVFIEFAIGIAKREENDHGSQTKKNPRISGGVTEEEQRYAAARAGLGGRAKQRSKIRN